MLPHNSWRGSRCASAGLFGAGRLGITLIEMLVAMSVTLVMMGAILTWFGWVSDTVGSSRAEVGMAERLRAARNRLQLDLAGITAPMLPPLRPEADMGYFEYIEGPINDLTAVGINPQNTLTGDGDDTLLFTTRSKGEPFSGKFNATTIDSQVAEVAWFTRPTRTILTANGGSAQLYTLYRRVLIVAPNVGNLAAQNFFDNYDISAHPATSGAQAGQVYIPNTLGDLTKRENRLNHFPGTGVGGFPFPAANMVAFQPPANAQAPTRFGDDVILTNVLAFDVRVYDPTARTYAAADGTIMQPGDFGYTLPDPNNTPIYYGAYVDLNYANTVGVSYFGGPMEPRSGLPAQTAPGNYATYDTGTFHYEQDGLDQDNQYGADQGTNGLDDNNDGVVDDPAEYETSPPYTRPLRGLQVKIRVYEPDSRQVREVTVVQDFLQQ